MAGFLTRYGYDPEAPLEKTVTAFQRHFRPSRVDGMADAETRALLAGLIALYDAQKRGCAMKTMGLLAGMSWESSSVYYQLINRQVQQRLGGVHSAKALMYSFDFGEVSRLQQSARWDEATELLSRRGPDPGQGRRGFSRHLLQHHAPDGR